MFSVIEALSYFRYYINYNEIDIDPRTQISIDNVKIFWSKLNHTHLEINNIKKDYIRISYKLNLIKNKELINIWEEYLKESDEHLKGNNNERKLPLISYD